MYCSSCGLEVPHELNYCNRCGANLGAPANLIQQAPSPPVRLTGPTIALGVTIVFSLMAIFSGASNLALRGVHPTAIAWMVIVGLGMVFGVAALFIRLWTRLLTNNTVQIEQRPPQLKRGQQNPQLNGAQTGPMNVPISSVTDHTTRTFEPAYRDRIEKGSK